MPYIFKKPLHLGIGENREKLLQELGIDLQPIERVYSNVSGYWQAGVNQVPGNCPGCSLYYRPTYQRFIRVEWGETEEDLNQKITGEAHFPNDFLSDLKRFQEIPAVLSRLGFSFTNNLEKVLNNVEQIKESGLYEIDAEAVRITIQSVLRAYFAEAPQLHREYKALARKPIAFTPGPSIAIEVPQSISTEAYTTNRPFAKSVKARIVNFVYVMGIELKESGFIVSTYNPPIERSEAWMRAINQWGGIHNIPRSIQMILIQSENDD